ncbi:hypothetical protein L6452_40176 [Arctium lappa]|uniref:Uncharacterized protein n=1 Tax=Arctium lappa TaxID=4217 RepID=A0ACB8XQC3_ARCLA|nr:hypothetical protein L6452_40176 [Arctium lappa]
MGKTWDLGKEWRKQFYKSYIRPLDVMRLILQTDDLGFMFKINFMVLFVNLMADCNSLGSCNLGFLSKLKDDDMLSKIDWCIYIYDKLRISKQRWRRDNDLCFYAGPLIYLTEYMELMDRKMKNLIFAKDKAGRVLDTTITKFPGESMSSEVEKSERKKSLSKLLDKELVVDHPLST